MPAKLTEKAKSIKQMPLRIHENDKKMFKKLLLDDGITAQHFFRCVVTAYLNGDPAILKLVKQWKELLEIPAEEKASYTLSQREREKILRELEQVPKENDE